jgi:hypothetical protein
MIRHDSLGTRRFERFPRAFTVQVFRVRRRRLVRRPIPINPVPAAPRPRLSLGRRLAMAA